MGIVDSGTTNAIATTPTRAIGTFTKKIDPKKKCVMRAPPAIGPRAMAIPVVAPHNPNALARSRRSSKTTVNVESVAGKMNAALAPINARAVKSVETLCENAASSENTENANSPICMTRLRPKRSESPPPASKSPANGNE